MSDMKVTDIMLDRIKYFINAIENGEYKPQSYEFTILFGLQHSGSPKEQRMASITDAYSMQKQ